MYPARMPSIPTVLLTALALLQGPAAQDLSGIDLSGAWKLKAKVTFDPNEFGLKGAKLVMPLHLVQLAGVLTGSAVDQVKTCGAFLAPVDGSAADGAFTLHVLAPGHDPKTCEELGTFELTASGVAQDNVFAHVSGTGAVELLGFVFPFTLDGAARRLSGMQTPDDPDGPGPAVPLDQMGSGEPGTEGAHDLAVTRLRAPKSVKTKGAPSTGAGVFKVQVQNRGQHAETIDDAALLAQLVTLELLPGPTGGFGWKATLHPPAPGKFPLVLQPRAKLTVTFDVTFAEAGPSPQDEPCLLQDFEVTAQVHHDALAGGQPDDHPEDDVAPRGVLAPYAFDTYPDGRLRDRGVGGKQPDGTLGAPVMVQVGYCVGGL